MNMAPSYTSKAQVTAVLTPLVEICEAARTGLDLGHRRGIVLSDVGLTNMSGTGAYLPGLSNHQRLSIEAILDAVDKHTIDPLRDLVAHIPPLRQSRVQSEGRELSLAMEDGNSERHPCTILTIDGVEITVRSPQPLNPLVNDLYAFIRTHENIEMGPDLHPFRCVPAPEQVRMCLWADTADNALLRFAACDRYLRSDLRSGKSYACVQADTEVPQHIKDALNKKTRPSPAPQPKDYILNNAWRF
jgi:hypothetical protein